MATMQDIQRVCDEIVMLCNPRQVILYNIKVTLADEIKNFALCVILDTQNKYEAERAIYLQVESPVPFDIVVYTQEECAHLCEDSGTFMNRILTKGKVLYDGAKNA